MFSGTIGVAVRVLEAILRENEATGSRKVFKYLLGLQDTILSPKLLDEVPKSKKIKNTIFCRIFPYRLYILFGVSRWDHISCGAPLATGQAGHEAIAMAVAMSLGHGNGHANGNGHGYSPWGPLPVGRLPDLVQDVFV